MASKLNKRLQVEIIENPDLKTNSRTGRVLTSATNKLQSRNNTKSSTVTEQALNESSDIENLFQHPQLMLQQKNDLTKERTSLRLKLRRSTEQSLYKIDTDSDTEKAVPKFRRRLLRPRKESCSDAESEGSYTDSKENSMASDMSSCKKVIDKQMENEIPTRSRIRKPPAKFSSYECEMLSSEKSLRSTPDTPSLRRRKNINYNEDKLFLKSVLSSVDVKEKLQEKKKDNTQNDTNIQQSPKAKQSNTKTIKRNRVPSLRVSDSDSSTDASTMKAKFSKISTKLNWNEEHQVYLSPKAKKVLGMTESVVPTMVATEGTPVKANAQKRVIPAQQPNNDNKDTVDEESLTDMYKRIKISSASIDATPTRSGSRRRVVSKHIKINGDFDGGDKSDVDDQSLANMYKSIKISSAKKNAQTPPRRSRIQKGIELDLDQANLSTPKSRFLKTCNLTPSLEKRNSALLKPATPLQEARSRLHVSAVPKSLPCREEEFNDIFTFLRGKLEDKSGGCIYISGVPGTGKTATVNEAVRCLQKLITKNQLDDFNYVAINAMKLTEPRQAYVQILKQLDDKTATWEQAYRILEKRFHAKTSKMTLLLVDELDFLCTKRQDVVYNILDWPTKSTAQLVVITIANTMDLPERILMGRVTSRLGLTRLTFQPYNYKQLQEIVMSRLRDFSGFRSEAVQLVARKVSAVSGDARRALDICRRAMEIAETRNAEMISLNDVTEAVTEMIASAKVQAIKHCSKMEQIFLQAVSAEVTRTSIEEVFFTDAYRQLQSLCSFDGIEVPTVTEVLAICGRLGANRLLICEHSRNDVYQKILLNVSTDDIHYAIQELDFKN